MMSVWSNLYVLSDSARVNQTNISLVNFPVQRMSHCNDESASRGIQSRRITSRDKSLIRHETSIFADLWLNSSSQVTQKAIKVTWPTNDGIGSELYRSTVTIDRHKCLTIAFLSQRSMTRLLLDKLCDIWISNRNRMERDERKMLQGHT